LENGLFFAGFAAPGSAEVSVADKTADVAPQVAGKAGEMASGIVKGAKESFIVDGVKRIPDQTVRELNRLAEVKNSAYQAFTKQLKDDLTISKQQGFQAPLLYFRDTTRLSKPLQNAIGSGQFVGLSLIRDVLTTAVQVLTKLKGK
jgi:hypothetical protein